MPHYEVIWEDSTVSVLNCDNDEEALAGVLEQDRRARAGLAGGPAGDTAKRVARILAYDVHPGSYGESGVSADVAQASIAEAIAACTVDGVVDLTQVAVYLRDLQSAMINNAAPHATKFKMQEVRELELSV